MAAITFIVKKDARNKNRADKIFVLTDLEAEKLFGDDAHIEAKIRLAFQRKASHEGTESHFYGRIS